MEAVWSWAEEREREEFPTYSDWSKQGWEAVSAEVAPGSWILAVEHWEVYVRLHTGRNSRTMVNPAVYTHRLPSHLQPQYSEG